MNTKYVIANDGVKIAYQTFGEGPAILLAHAGGRDKRMWLDNAWVDILKDHFTVIAIDMRGCGESDKSYKPEFYQINKILEDIEIVVNECGFKEYNYFGHSYGATIGLQLCSQSTNVRKAICAGTRFGDSFFRLTIPEWIKGYEEIGAKKKENRLEDLELTQEELEWAEETDFDLMLAQFRAWNSWPGVEPKDVRACLAIYTGTEDSAEVLEDMKNVRDELMKYNIRSNIFEGLDHMQLVGKTETVLPWIREFLCF